MATRDKKPADIRETFKRYRLALPVAARVPDCKRLCAGWHNRFGACLTLDDQRLRALCKRLVDDQVRMDDCVWAIEAYAQYCKTDDWHRNHPAAHKTLAAFFQDDRFEGWMERGRDLRCRQSKKEGAAIAAAVRAKTEMQELQAIEARKRRIRDYYNAQPAGVQAELLAAAWSRLPSFLRRVLRKPSIDHASIVAEVGKMMDAGPAGISDQSSVVSSQSEVGQVNDLPNSVSASEFTRRGGRLPSPRLSSGGRP